MNRLPTVFISHGAPTFALEPGVAGARLAQLGRTLERPRAVLVVSPHWMTRAPIAGTAERPDTIHDFGGFDPELYQIEYPAPGHPELARRALERLRDAGWAAHTDERRGLDHGAWVPLLHLYPRADVPVFQVSMPATLDAASAWGLGEALAPLADEGVLIVGSGGLTHNIREFFEGRDRDTAYAAEFAAWVREAVLAGDAARIRSALAQAPHAPRAHPTPEHFWPLLVAAAAAASPGAVLHGGELRGTLSMDSFVFRH
ncbi:MAG TPA: class III extradiol ring-cleavage dioxygenase [Burkholderiaceae bacterium]